MGCYHYDYGTGAQYLYLLLLLLHVLCVLYRWKGEASCAQAASWSGDRCHHGRWHVSVVL